MRAHDVWLYQWIYDRGDDRVRRFLTGFAPVAPQWAALRQKLRLCVCSDTHASRPSRKRWSSATFSARPSSRYAWSRNGSDITGTVCPW